MNFLLRRLPQPHVKSRDLGADNLLSAPFSNVLNDRSVPCVPQFRPHERQLPKSFVCMFRTLRFWTTEDKSKGSEVRFPLI
jgi:hypothetical protein